MKKNRFFSVLLSFLMCFLLFGMVACGNGEPNGGNGGNSGSNVTVTFVVDGSAYASVEVKEGAEFPADPTKDGETFLGWYLDNGVWSNQFTDFSTATQSMKVYARFSQAVTNVTVTFMANGSEYASVEVKEGAEFPANPTKDGEAFLGWYLDDGVWSNKLTDLATVTQSITVYARFGQALTLTYYINNNEYYTDVIDGQSAITLPATPAIDGFEFKGWYFKNYAGNWTTTQLTEDYFVNNNTTQNKTVYAKIQMITKDNSASGAYEIKGDYLYMGKYPTSIKPASTSIKSTPNSDGYYEDYSGNLYVKVESCVHNNKTNYPTTKRFFQDGDTIIEDGKTYYFKVETIKWAIIEKDDDTALVMPTQVLFKSQYKATADEGIDIRDYENSDIRAYMNKTLINEIFTEAERSVILTSWVDNSSGTICATGYKSTWKDTYDKLFLLEQTFLSKASNRKYLSLPVSDYMRATGMPMYSQYPTGGDYGYTYSWARGFIGSTPKGISVIGTDASAASLNADEQMAYGVVPVFRVDL